jgi:hypothetical protein
LARRVFFSFHYQRDIWRVNQIRNIPNVTGCAAAGFQDASIWEEVKRKGDGAVKALINKGLENTSVTVVCVGYKTAGRAYINYEIDQSIARGNGIVAVQIHHLEDKDGGTDSAGAIPSRFNRTGTWRINTSTTISSANGSRMLQKQPEDKCQPTAMLP